MTGILNIDDGKNQAKIIANEAALLSKLGRSIGSFCRKLAERLRFKILKNPIPVVFYPEDSISNGYVEDYLSSESIQEKSDQTKTKASPLKTPAAPAPKKRALSLLQRVAIFENAPIHFENAEWEQIEDMVKNIKNRDHPQSTFKISAKDHANPFQRAFIIQGQEIYALESQRYHGKGYFGKVRLAYSKSSETLAVKVLLDKFGNKHYICQKYYGVDLQKLLDLGRISALESLEIAYQAAKELAAIHAKNIIHNDISAKNIVLNHRGMVHLVDFGLATQLAEGELEYHPKPIRYHDKKVVLINRQIAAPESKAPHFTLSKKTDIYALGLFFKYELKLRQSPKLLEQMLAVNAQDRPDIPDILKQLESFILSEKSTGLTQNHIQQFEGIKRRKRTHKAQSMSQPLPFTEDTPDPKNLSDRKEQAQPKSSRF